MFVPQVPLVAVTYTSGRNVWKEVPQVPHLPRLAVNRWGALQVCPAHQSAPALGARQTLSPSLNPDLTENRPQKGTRPNARARS